VQKAPGIQYSKLGVISLAHMLNDLYSNCLPQLLPFLVVLHQGFTATRAAILVSAFSITSSVCPAVFWLFYGPAKQALALVCGDVVDGSDAQLNRNC
jgi:FSR family fosmidomycin resistance protein-like MFS transporter